MKIGIAYYDGSCNVILTFDNEKDAMSWLLSNAWKYMIIDIFKSKKNLKIDGISADMKLVEECIKE